MFFRMFSIGRRVPVFISVFSLAAAVIIFIGNEIYGYHLIESMYKGESLPVLNRVISGQLKHPLNDYVVSFNGVIVGIVASLFFVAFLAMSLRALSSRTLVRSGYLVAVLLSPIFMIVFISMYQIDLPVDDHWFLLPYVEKMNGVGLVFGDFLEPYNQYQMFFPKVAMLGLAYISNWNISYEILFNVYLMIALFSVVSFHLFFSAKKMGGDARSWPYVLISVFIFSLNQWENFFLPMQWYVVTLSVVIGLLFVASFNAGWLSIFWGVMFGLVATFSSPHGLIFWPIGIIFLIVSGYIAGRINYRKIFAFIAVSCSVVFYYIHGLEGSIAGGALTQAYSNTFSVIQYALANIASPIVTKNVSGAIFVGIIGVVAYVFLGVLSVFKQKDLGKSTVPYLALGMFSLGSAILTALGRLEYHGVAGAMSTRYVTVSSIFWVSVVALVYLTYSCDQLRAGFSKGDWNRWKAGAISFCFIIALTSIVHSYAYSRRAGVWLQEKYLEPARNHVLLVDEPRWDDEIVRRLNPLVPITELKAALVKLKTLKMAAYSE